MREAEKESKYGSAVTAVFVLSMDGFRFLAPTGPFWTARWDRWAKTVHSEFVQLETDCSIFTSFEISRLKIVRIHSLSPPVPFTYWPITPITY